MDDSFLFVPEAGSSTSSSRNQQRLVRAHVMRKQWQLVRNLKPNNNNNNKAKTKAKNTITEVEKDEDELDSHKTPRRKACVVPKFTTKQAQTKRVLPPPPPPPRSMALIKRASGMPLAKKIVDEPISSIKSTFNSAGISMNAKSFDYFDHFSREFNEVLCDPAQPIIPSQSDTFSFVAIHKNSPALVHAMCFMGAAHEALIRADPDRRPTLVKTLPEAETVLNEAIYHKSMCLERLKDSFKPPNTPKMDSEATILCIALLTASEASYGHFEHITVHSNGLCQVINLLGGIDHVPQRLRLHVYLAELKAATAQLRPHAFALPPYLRRRFEDQKYWPVVDGSKDFPDRFTGPGSGFFTQSLLAPTSPPLIHCISYARHLHNIKFFMQGHSEVYSVFDYVALDHEILSLMATKMNLLDQCVQTGLLLYSNTVFWKPPVFFNWIVQVRKRLFLLLKALVWEEAILYYPKLLLWLLMMGVYSVRLENNAESEWWTAKLQEVVASLALQNGSEARDCMREFFYSEDVYGWVWQEVFSTEEPKARRQQYPCIRQQLEY